MSPIKMLCLAASGLLISGSTVTAQDTGRPVKVGVLTDLSSAYSDTTGRGSILAVRMALEDAGGKIGPLPVEILSADHRNKPDVGAALARKWFEVDQVDAIFDVANTPIALAISSLATNMNRLLFTNGASTIISGERCSENTFQWSHDNYTIAYPATRQLLDEGSKKWFFLTVDYAFGHDLEAVSARIVRKAGGEVLGAVRHPIDNPDFSSFLVQAQGSGASAIGLANSGADTTVSVKQANEFGIRKRGVRLAPLNASIVNIDALGLEAAQGIYVAEPFNPDRDSRTRAWSERFFKQHGRLASFGQVGMYSAAYAYFKVLQAMYAEDPSSVHDGRKVAARLRATPTDDAVYGKGRVREDGRHVHDMYLFKVKAPSESKQRWDYYTLVRTFPGEETMLPAAESQCKLFGKKS